MTKNYYDILGIAPNADLATIQQAARSKAQAVETAYNALSDADKQTAHQNMQAQANEISTAFKVLSDPAQREAYDAEIAAMLHQATSINMSVNEDITLTQSTSHEDSAGRKLLKRLTTIDTPSFKDVAIFIVAVAFFAYMVSGFFIPRTERLARSAESTLEFRQR